MPRKATNAKKNVSPRVAEEAVWNAALDGTVEELQKMADSEDENINAAYADLAERVGMMNDADLALGQQVIQAGKRNKYAGNVLAASEMYSHGKNAKEIGTQIFHGGKWVAGKLSTLIG